MLCGLRVGFSLTWPALPPINTRETQRREFSQAATLPSPKIIPSSFESFPPLFLVSST